MGDNGRWKTARNISLVVEYIQKLFILVLFRFNVFERFNG